MKINAIGTDYSAIKTRRVKTKAVETPTEPKVPNGMSMISFRAGNPKHIAHIVAEEPLLGFNGGGVGTVVNDYNFLDKDVEKVVKIIPLYNQEVEYKKNIDPKTGKVMDPLPQNVKVRYIPENLPADHPFKGKEGTAFVTGQTLDSSTDLAKFLEKEKNSVFLLEEVKSGKMNWGMEENVPIKMFKAQKNEHLKDVLTKKGMSPELQEKLEFVFTYVDSTASMPKQYADGSYASTTSEGLAKRLSSGWSGQPYAKYNKASVELMSGLKDKYGLDPKYFLCSDGQSMFTMHYAAQKNAAGDAYWTDKFLGGVGHNMNRGYIQEMGAKQAIVNLGATKEELLKLVNSKEYIEALQKGREEDFLKESVLKNFYNKNTGMSAYSIPIHYGKAGYVPMLTTVSEGYHKSIISNELVSPLYSDLKELDKLGRFKGLLNPLMDPNVTPFAKTILLPGYREEVKLKLKDGSEVTVSPLQVFDKDKCDLQTIRSVKQKNKINLLERLDDKFIDAQAFNKTKNTWEKPNTGRMQILAGLPNKEAKIHGAIDGKYLADLKAGKDVKLVISWGRGDFQKGMDTVIDSFEKYIQKTNDQSAILLFGGPMENDEAKAVVEKFKSKMNEPHLKGKMVMFDGWAPGKDWSITADVAVLPSRFAPCELSDLEAKKALCTPIVPNVQGMADKNFDPSITEEAKLMDAYKGKHEFFMTEETALKAANEDAKKEFNQVKGKLVDEIKKKYKGKINEEIPESLLKETLEGKEEYTKALKKLRDSVISDEMAECMKRALIDDRNGKIPETILANQAKADTTWFGNAWLSKTGKSSGQLYQDYHFNNKGKNIAEKDLIKLDFSGLTAGKAGKKGLNFGGKTKTIAGIALGAAALVGLGVAGYKQGWFSSKFEEKKEEGNLSCVG